MIKERLSYMASIVITIMLLLMAITENPIYLYLSLGISAVFIFDPYVVFSAYFVSSLSGGFFSVANIGAARLFSIFAVLSLLLNVRKGTVYTKHLPLGVFLIVFSFLSCAFSITGSFTPFYGMLQCLLVTCLLIGVKLDNKRLFNTIVLNSIAVLVAIVVQTYLNPNVLWEERFSIGDVNANNFAMMCAQLGAVMIGALFFYDNRIVRGFMALAYVISAYIIVLSGSRSSLLGLFSAGLFVLLAGFSKDKKRNILIIIVFLILGIVSVTYLSQIDSPIIQRFNANDVIESGGTGRLTLMKIIISQVILNHPFFGVGMGGQNIMAMGIPKQCHNIIVDPVSQIGLVGYTLFLLFIVPQLSSAYKSLKISKIAIIPLTMTIAAIVNGMGEVIFYEKFLWNDIALCGLVGALVLQTRANNKLK